MDGVNTTRVKRKTWPVILNTSMDRFNTTRGEVQDLASDLEYIHGSSEHHSK
jgi:hypothetical protein